MMNAEIRLLLVEDDEPFSRLVGQMLLRSDATRFNVVIAGSLAAALGRAKETGFDIALLDLNLPDSTGFETFSRFRSEVPDLPVIVLSGVTDETLAAETVLHGAQDYLIKGPLNHHWLNRAIRHALERIEAGRELLRAHAELEARIVARTADLADANHRLKSEIADRKRAESALRDSNRELAMALERLRQTREASEQREHLRALGRMASGIAHDFNNALAPILGFSQILLSDPDLLSDQVKVRRYLGMINDAANHGAKVVSRLRDFYKSREEAPPAKVLDLNDLLGRVIELTRPNWRDQAQARGANIVVKKTFAPDSPRLSGSEVDLQEIFAALMLDAADAIQREGSIEVATRRDDGSVLATFRYETEGSLGRSVHEENDLVADVVARHGGSIATASEGQNRYELTISFPEERSLLSQSVVNVKTDPDPLRILVVEDDSMVREVITVFLTEDHHTVEVAENGREGLEKFSAAEYDLVLTDRSMPGMNGDQLAFEVKRIKPDLPIILLTGYGDLMQGSNEKPEGVDLILSKPFTIESLRGAINQAVAR